MLAICAYCAHIMLNAFATYYAHNYAGIIGLIKPSVQRKKIIRKKQNIIEICGGERINFERL